MVHCLYSATDAKTSKYIRTAGHILRYLKVVLSNKLKCKEKLWFSIQRKDRNFYAVNVLMYASSCKLEISQLTPAKTSSGQVGCIINFRVHFQ